jgi:hypothetical protein
MKLIKQLNDNLLQAKAAPVVEDAAGGGTGAGAIAGGAMPLFSQLIKRTKRPAKKREPFIAQQKHLGLGLAEATAALREFEGDDVGQGKGPQSGFDTSEVISKLKGLETKEKADHRDTVTFGLEDENQNIVRVTVKSEQAEDFERSLQAFMQTAETEEERTPDVAEILFKLKDRFDIIDVEWPDVEQDEEEDMGLDAPEGEAGGEPGMEGGEDTMGLDAPEGDMGADMGGGADTAGVTDLLTQVIDMMKADAEARKAEARAREAEAKTKEADALVAQSMSRVKQEEQYLDMETYNKAKKDEDREAKRLAQLAKWKHDMNKDSGMGGGDDFEMPAADAPLVPNPEEEEVMRRPARSAAQPSRNTARVRARVAPHDIAQFIIDRVK